ncbi:MAG: DUF2971 domain-containing protein [Terricaulis sp.]
MKKRSAQTRKILTDFAWYRRKRLDDIFVFCLSEVRGSAQRTQLDGALSQWRAYADGGHGALLVFRMNQLAATELMRSARTSFSRVTYDPEEQEFCIEQLTEAFLLMLTNDNEGILKYYFATDLDVIVTLMKDERFSEEREWRVVVDNGYRSPDDRELPIRFRDSNGLKVPYVELSVRANDKYARIPLAATVVGPAVANKDAALASLHYFCGEHAASGQVIISKTPFRNR